MKDSVPVEEFDDDFTAQCFLIGCAVLFGIVLFIVALL